MIVVDDEQIVRYLAFLHLGVCRRAGVIDSIDVDHARRLAEEQLAAQKLLDAKRSELSADDFAQLERQVNEAIESRKPDLDRDRALARINAFTKQDEAFCDDFSKPFKLVSGAWNGLHDPATFEKHLTAVSVQLCLYLGLTSAELRIQNVPESGEWDMETDEPTEMIVGRFSPPRTIRVTYSGQTTPVRTLSILTHETCHYFLHNRRIKLEDQDENEILTELATTYLNLTDVRVTGHTESRSSWYGDITRVLGYVTADTLSRADELARQLRKPIMDIASELGRRRRSSLTPKDVGRKVRFKSKQGESVVAVVLRAHNQHELVLVDLINPDPHGEYDLRELAISMGDIVLN